MLPGEGYQFQVRAKDLTKLKLADHVRFGLFATVLQDERDRALRAGQGTEGRMPRHRVNVSQPRERWEQSTEAGPNKGTAAVPASVFQQLRVAGGHREQAVPGVEWKGGTPILYGKDAAAFGAIPGTVWGYVWKDAGSFLAQNYGPSVGIRTGRMLLDRRYRVVPTKDGAVVTITFKGRRVEGRPIWALLKEEQERVDAAKAGGRKPRKTPATTKAALLEALGREGTVGGAGAPGFQEPRKKSLEQAMRVFTDEFVQEVGALPIRVVVR